MIAGTNAKNPPIVKLVRLLDPFFSDPALNVRLPWHLRILRAAFVTGRNLLYLAISYGALGSVARWFPKYVMLTLGAAALISLYGWIRARERRGDAVNPAATLALFLLLLLVMAYLRSLVDQTGFQARFDYVIAMDKVLFGGQVPTVWLQRHLHASGGLGPVDLLTTGIYLSYFVAPILAAVALWHLDHSEFRLYLVAIFIATFAGALYFAAVPTAPPWLAASSGHLPDVVRIVPVVLEKVGPGTYERGYEAVGVNEVAAFPSFHMLETLLVVFAIRRVNSRLWRPGLVYAGSMGFALVYLGEHYASDILAGAFLAVATWMLALRITPALFVTRVKRLDLSPQTPERLLAA